MVYSFLGASYKEKAKEYQHSEVVVHRVDDSIHLRIRRREVRSEPLRETHHAGHPEIVTLRQDVPDSFTTAVNLHENLVKHRADGSKFFRQVIGRDVPHVAVQNGVRFSESVSEELDSRLPLCYYGDEFRLPSKQVVALLGQ